MNQPTYVAFSLPLASRNDSNTVVSVSLRYLKSTKFFGLRTHSSIKSLVERMIQVIAYFYGSLIIIKKKSSVVLGSNLHRYFQL